jgi:hypothetical protein
MVDVWVTSAHIVHRIQNKTNGYVAVLDIEIVSEA